MTEAEILATTYSDTCHVFRKEEGEDEDGRIEYVEKLIYADEKCALSKGGSSQNNTEVESTTTIDYDLVLFVMPDCHIKVNDKVIIKEREYVAGEGFEYVSHCEVPLRRNTEYED